ncbi:hypothetical protein PSE10B_25020 [Pseudomonas amygdali pv. eriobotryae]|nr:hypothetical protein PSE10B_25020 [Pseudomonas amygdali pv. eriobotryae]
MTLRVTNLRRTACSKEGAERPERHATRSVGTIIRGVSARHLSFLTLQRRNALGDAPRHKSAPHRML